jgi:hypothetical protein
MDFSSFSKKLFDLLSEVLSFHENTALSVFIVASLVFHFSGELA